MPTIQPATATRCMPTVPATQQLYVQLGVVTKDLPVSIQHSSLSSPYLQEVQLIHIQNMLHQRLLLLQYHYQSGQLQDQAKTVPLLILMYYATSSVTDITDTAQYFQLSSTHTVCLEPQTCQCTTCVSRFAIVWSNDRQPPHMQIHSAAIYHLLVIVAMKKS